jgi:nitrate/nitrite transport system ATP-binding protein
LGFIEVKNISKSFHSDRGVREVLKDVSVSVEEGEFISIVGFTGSGKSTLLSIIAGLQKADAGEVSVAGERVLGVHGQTSFVFQNYSLLPWLSALENVRLAVETAYPSWSRSEKLQKAEQYLQTVGLGKAMHRRPGQLSGGMRQRVAIARAFATDPAILFLDEPFSALDALTRSNLQQELVRLCSEASRPVTTIMITNSLDEALLLSDRIVALTRGPAATLGSPIQVPLARPRSEAQLLHDQSAVRIRAQVVESLADFIHAKRRQSKPPGINTKSELPRDVMIAEERI